jgi:sortase A
MGHSTRNVPPLLRLACAGAFLFLVGALLPDFPPPTTAAEYRPGVWDDLPEDSPLRRVSIAPATQGEPFVGRIRIARVGVDSLILEGVDDETIRRAVGHFPETPMPHQRGNVALAAHRGTDFWGLRNIRLGDVVSVTTPYGEFQYEVAQTFVVMPEEVHVLRPTRDDVLTLVTCFPFDYRGPAPKRFIVRARALPSSPAVSAQR